MLIENNRWIYCA